MPSPRYQFRLDQLRTWAHKPRDGIERITEDDKGPVPHDVQNAQVIEALEDRVQALAQELLRLRRREVLRMGGFDR